jgi:tartrate/fumarate subfamily iron-sulfur-dependent hydro-lyase alpha chain
MVCDVLVVGSGASGLAAAVSAERAGARVALVTKGALQSCNSAKAQGGIQAAFGEDDSPEQHAEDVWQSSHETADRRLVEVLTGEAPAAIRWLEGHGVEFTPENGGYRLARCGGASRRRLLQVGDRTGHAITTALRDAFLASSGEALPNCPLVALEQRENGWVATCRRKNGEELVIEAGAVVLAAGGRCYREAEERGELSTNHPGATGEVTRLALELGADSRDLDALQYHPNGGAWPPTMQGYSIPETTRAYGATLLNAEGEEYTDRPRRRDSGRPSGGPARHDACPRGRRRDLASVHAAPLPFRRDRPPAGAGLHLPRPPLPERRPRDRRARRDDPARPICLRRDRRRHPRPQPDDGQQPARVHGFRPACRGRRSSEGCMSAIATDLRQTVEDAAAYLYVWALKDIPQDLRNALLDAQARETSVPGRRVLDTIVRNVQVADDGGNLVCQDTGIAVYTCRVGEHFPLHPAKIYEALKAGTERATLEHPLRSNAVHTLTRENTGPNTGYRLPIVHWEFIADWDGLDVKCVPKGSGSENMSFLKMCVPADGVKGIKQFVLESIVESGGKPCPPGIVGVGIGGSADYAMYLAKEAITRPIGTRNPDPHVAKLEDELYELLNETGIGPMGLGGDVTVLNCHIEHADTHMTLNPVAVNYQCWAARRATAHVAANGDVEFDREA